MQKRAADSDHHQTSYNPGFPACGETVMISNDLNQLSKISKKEQTYERADSYFDGITLGYFYIKHAHGGISV